MKNDYIICSDGTAQIRLKRKLGPDLWTVIDIGDLGIAQSFPGSWVPKWNNTAKTWYARNNKFGSIKTGYLHRKLMGITDPSVWVDHKDHNGLNNRRSTNLIKSDVKSNGWNRKGAEVGSMSRRRNVYWNHRGKKWMVWFVHQGTRYYFGCFSDLDEADRVAKRERARFSA